MAFNNFFGNAHFLGATMILRMSILILAALVLSGCGIMAAPCRVTSAALKMVPVVGHVAALPTDGCAAIID